MIPSCYMMKNSRQDLTLYCCCIILQEFDVLFFYKPTKWPWVREIQMLVNERLVVNQ